MTKSKLTEADKEKIRQLYKEGHSQTALAVLFEVSPMTIYRILNPENYRKSLERSLDYQRENLDRITQQRNATRKKYYLTFSLTKDADVIKKLDEQENTQDYIRNLITNDINNGKQP